MWVELQVRQPDHVLCCTAWQWQAKRGKGFRNLTLIMQRFLHVWIPSNHYQCCSSLLLIACTQLFCVFLLFLFFFCFLFISILAIESNPIQNVRTNNENEITNNEIRYVAFPSHLRIFNMLKNIEHQYLTTWKMHMVFMVCWTDHISGAYYFTYSWKILIVVTTSTTVDAVVVVVVVLRSTSSSFSLLVWLVQCSKF